MIEYRRLQEQDLSRSLFRAFVRRQVVTKCWRKTDGVWHVVDAPFVDDWSEEDYQTLVSCLRRTVATGGFVCAGFHQGALKGFVSVESVLFGQARRYLDLSSLHVSADMRGHGLGTALFSAAGAWARRHGAQSLYLSAHSAVESQAFYKAMGCVEAREYDWRHVDAEPYDCQLECPL